MDADTRLLMSHSRHETMPPGAFSQFVQRSKRDRRLVIQPRMGFSSTTAMREALHAVRAESDCIGTITVDSYTRVGDYLSPLAALRDGIELNGYPILSHSAEATVEMLGGLIGGEFPIQVRHGTAEPQAIFRRMTQIGLTATEGGPISYCLPYGRTPIDRAASAWEEGCHILANECDSAHLETFGGCLLGQLCPPSLLVAVSLLEGLFFASHGIRSVSLSYAQQTSSRQDRAALNALRRLAMEFLPSIDWHVVLYTYMGLFPRTRDGAYQILRDSAELAVHSGCERLIVKTAVERQEIPSVAENVAAIRAARNAAETATFSSADTSPTPIYEDAKSIIELTLNGDSSITRALVFAVRRGIIDVPYCQHPDNRGMTRAVIDDAGELRWTRIGNMPVKAVEPSIDLKLTSTELLRQLAFVSRRYDEQTTSPEHA
jgi:methylaspartate mutase epsilon subunit